MFDDYQFQEPPPRKYHCVCGAILVTLPEASRYTEDFDVQCEMCGYHCRVSELEE